MEKVKGFIQNRFGPAEHGLTSTGVPYTEFKNPEEDQNVFSKHLEPLFDQVINTQD